MSQQLSSRRTNTRKDWHSHPIYEERTCGTEKLRLLKAPSVNADPMWKAQSFDFAQDLLRAKLGTNFTADNVISIFNKHFPLNTMTAEGEAKRVKAIFRKSFGQVQYLTPTLFLNKQGNDQTGFMHRTNRPP